MDKINKNRKGMIFEMMTEEEQECLKKQDNIIFYISNQWSAVSTPNWDTSLAYWCSDWDKPTGEKLVGKLCYTEVDGLFGVCIEYGKDKHFQYLIGGEYCREARLATRAEALSLIEVE